MHLHLAKRLCDRVQEGLAYSNLGNVYQGLGEFQRVIEYHNLSLDISKEVGNRAAEGSSYGCLGIAYQCLGDMEQAIKYYKLRLLIAKELNDRAGEGGAYGNLGSACRSIGDLRQAIEYHELHLRISTELGARAGEGRAFGNLGNAYQGLGDFNKAIEYHKKHLLIARELEDKPGEGAAYCNLGNAYDSLSDFKQAIEYRKMTLRIAEMVGDRYGEGRAYANLGNAYQSLGDFEQAVKYHELHLRITKEMGDKPGKGSAHCNLGNAYQNLHDFKKAIDNHKLHLLIAKEIGDKVGGVHAYANLGIAYHSLGDFNQAMEYYKLNLFLAKMQGLRAEEGSTYGSIGNVYTSLGNFEKALEYHKLHLITSKELGDRTGEGLAYYHCGVCFQKLGAIEDALSSYRKSVKVLNEVRNLLQSNDEWKISLRNEYDVLYKAFVSLLITQNKTPEALLTSEQGRAQALEDLMMSKYDFKPEVQNDLEEIRLTDIYNCTKSDVAYVSLHGNDISIWLIKDGKSVFFSRHQFDVKYSHNTVSTDIQALVDETISRICRVAADSTCEDRSLDTLYDRQEDLRQDNSETPVHPMQDKCTRGDDKTSVRPQVDCEDLLRILYDVIVGPIADHIRVNELVIVPDGTLFLSPFPAFRDPKSRYLCDFLRIRMAPSLASLRLITNSPANYHATSGSLIVGDPNLEKIVKGSGRHKKAVFKQLPFAKQEAKIVAGILKTTPLIGLNATKTEILQRMNKVALVHIAAHGDRERGEIALAPNPNPLDSNVIKKEDYILTMAEVLNIGLRAQLVVLSCCNSGRGKVKAEGVVGIARAFLGAGARSVLVSLWAINDEATLEFMRRFYEHLANGRSASEALNETMKCMKRSEKFSAVKYWAPFMLVGDDVTVKCD